MKIFETTKNFFLLLASLSGGYFILKMGKHLKTGQYNSSLRDPAADNVYFGVFDVFRHGQELFISFRYLQSLHPSVPCPGCVQILLRMVKNM